MSDHKNTPATPSKTPSAVSFVERINKIRKLDGTDLQIHEIGEAIETYHNMIDRGDHRAHAAQHALRAIETVLGMSYEQYQQKPSIPLDRTRDFTKMDAITGAIRMYYEQIDNTGKGELGVDAAIQAGTAIRTIEATLGMDKDREQGGSAHKQNVEPQPYSVFKKRDPLVADPEGHSRG